MLLFSGPMVPSASAFTVIQSIKVNALVAATGAAASGTLYTAPASGYAVIQVNATLSGGTTEITLSVGGALVLDATSSTLNAVNTGIHVGPNQAVTYTRVGGGTGSVKISGVEFINS